MIGQDADIFHGTRMTEQSINIVGLEKRSQKRN